MISPDFMYMKHRHLLSREELEEENHVDTPKGLPTHSSILRCWILDGKIDGEEVDNNDTLPPIQIQRQKIVNTLHLLVAALIVMVCLYDHRQLQNTKNSQFSLGNSFWIHPLVELSISLFVCFAAWYPVSFFVAREAYLRMAAVMISPYN